MSQYNEFLSLEVPGLSEGRPSVMVGDRVILSDPAMLAMSPKYEGYVHEVRDSHSVTFAELLHLL
jgi:putative helicase MOV10L1